MWQARNEQGNADWQQPKLINLIIQQEYKLCSKMRCKYCDKSFNSITNHGKHLKVCAEAANDCKLCRKTFTGVKQYQNLKWSCNTKSHNCMACHKTFGHTDSLAAHVRLHYPCQKISLVQSVLLFVWQKKICKHIFHKNMFSQLNKWLDVNLVGGSIYSKYLIWLIVTYVSHQS